MCFFCDWVYNWNLLGELKADDFILKSGFRMFISVYVKTFQLIVRSLLSPGFLSWTLELSFICIDLSIQVQSSVRFRPLRSVNEGRAANTLGDIISISTRYGGIKARGLNGRERL